MIGAYIEPTNRRKMSLMLIDSMANLPTAGGRQQSWTEACEAAWARFIDAHAVMKEGRMLY